MVLDFDLNLFVDNLRATKPPYECPINNCGKIYKSFCGIQFHVFNYDHDNPENNSPSPQRKPTNGKKKSKWKQYRQKNDNPPPQPTELMRPRETLTYAEAQRLVEIDLEGRIHRINIYEPLEIICQDEIDNQFNTEKEEKGEKSPTGKNSKDPPPKGRKEVSVSSHGGTTKLPEAQFKVIEDYVRPAHIKGRPNSYYRYIEKSTEELDEEVEYDMDEEVRKFSEVKLNDSDIGEEVSLNDMQMLRELLTH